MTLKQKLFKEYEEMYREYEALEREYPAASFGRMVAIAHRKSELDTAMAMVERCVTKKDRAELMDLRWKIIKEFSAKELEEMKKNGAA